ncbi:hypothetical protein HRbin35_00268 [bacterium HR35]|nr:hypothetical protein HRbin35_00268 [bacterium HR35]
MKNSLIGLAIGLILGLGISLLAWVNPPGNPPSGGGVIQTQNTGLFINTSTYFTSGNVGIGTTAPGAKLDVNGDINFAAYSWLKSGGVALLSYGGGDNATYLRCASDKCHFQNAAGNMDFITINSGNVGIGTTNPDMKLTIYGSGQNLMKIQSSDQYPRLYFQSADSVVGGVFNWDSSKNIYFGETGYTGEYYFRGTGNIRIGNDRVFISSSGNVGIGTTDPAHKLHLVRNDTVDVFYLSGCSIPANSTTFTCTGDISQVKPGMSLHVFASSYPSGYTPFWRTIVSVDYGSKTITLNHPSPPRNYDSTFTYMVARGGELISYQGSNYNYFTRLYGSNIYLSYNGSLNPINGGLGVDNGTFRFYSNRSFHFFLDTDNAFDDSTGGMVFSIGKNNSYFGAPYAEIFRVNELGQVWAPSYTCSSDIRLKENLRLISEVLPKLNKINVYKFTWNKTAKEKYSLTGEDIGVIAQEVEKYFPELITVDNNGYKNIKYDRLSFILLEAIKEQQKEIEELRNKIEFLEKTHK